MKDVPTPVQPRALPPNDDSHHPIRPVSAVEAALDASGEMILLRLREPDGDLDFLYALSPPAAKQLAEDLEQAVSDYLHGNLPLEFSLGDYVGGTE